MLEKHSQNIPLLFDIIGEEKCIDCGEIIPPEDNPDNLENWEAITDYFDSLGDIIIAKESSMLGLFSVAVPVNMSQAKIEELIDNCPVELITLK